MFQRIAIWTLLGVIVGCGWAALFAFVPGIRVDATSLVVVITSPIALVGRRMPISYQWAIFFNAITYALFGLMVELLWRRYRFWRVRVIAGHNR